MHASKVGLYNFCSQMQTQIFVNSFGCHTLFSLLFSSKPLKVQDQATFRYLHTCYTKSTEEVFSKTAFWISQRESGSRCDFWTEKPNIICWTETLTATTYLHFNWSIPFHGLFSMHESYPDRVHDFTSRREITTTFTHRKLQICLVRMDATDANCFLFRLASLNDAFVCVMHLNTNLN